MANLEFKNDLG